MNSNKQNALLTVGLMEEIDRLENYVHELKKQLALKEVILKHANEIITKQEEFIKNAMVIVDQCGGDM